MIGHQHGHADCHDVAEQVASGAGAGHHDDNAGERDGAGEQGGAAFAHAIDATADRGGDEGCGGEENDHVGDGGEAEGVDEEDGGERRAGGGEQPGLADGADGADRVASFERGATGGDEHAGDDAAVEQDGLGVERDEAGEESRRAVGQRGQPDEQHAECPR